MDIISKTKRLFLMLKEYAHAFLSTGQASAKHALGDAFGEEICL